MLETAASVGFHDAIRSSATVAEKIDPAVADVAVFLSPAGLRRTTTTRHPFGGLRGRPHGSKGRGCPAGRYPPLRPLSMEGLDASVQTAVEFV